MVIFLPMLQVGCCKASSGVTVASSSRRRFLKAPPEAVITTLDRSFCSPRRHCQMALGSLSTGRISTPWRLASPMTICPAMTTGSLLASATVFCARMAANMGTRPALPTLAAMTVSASGWLATSSCETTRHAGGRLDARDSGGSSQETALG